MYSIIRSLHLYMAAFITALFTVYVVTGLQLAHPFFEDLVNRESWSESKHTVPGEQASSPRQVARYLMEQGIRGNLMSVDSSSTAMSFQLQRAGVTHNVNFDRKTRVAAVSSRSGNLMSLFFGVHHVSGSKHDDWVMTAWAYSLALMSVLLILIGVTGIFMWTMRPKERKTGIVLLGISMLLGLGVAPLILVTS